LTGHPPEKPTVITAVTFLLCCLLCNCMEYSATWHVYFVENTECYETSWFSVKVTAVISFNTVVLDLGMGLVLTKFNAIFYALLQILKYKNTL
jgi:hypothetical protein